MKQLALHVVYGSLRLRKCVRVLKILRKDLQIYNKGDLEAGAKPEVKGN